MLINKDEIAEMAMSGEISDSDSLNAVLRGIIRDVVETAMKTELTGFPGYDKNKSPEADNGNRCNGFTQKEVPFKFGPIGPDVPRDRNAEFSPQIVKKRQKHFDGFEDLILSMYSRGMSTRDIQDHIRDISIMKFPLFQSCL